MNKLTNFAAGFAAIALITGSGAAQAAPTPDIMVVRLGDLNTSSQKGAETALRRIKHAAKAFCGPASREVERFFAGKACEQHMTNVAVAELNVPMVTALNSQNQPIRLAQTETSTR
jgi:UrcA family protein